MVGLVVAMVRASRVGDYREARVAVAEVNAVVKEDGRVAVQALATEVGLGAYVAMAMEVIEVALMVADLEVG